MPRLQLQFPQTKVDLATIELLAEALKPLTIRKAHESLELAHASLESDRLYLDHQIEQAESTIAAGGQVSIELVTLMEQNGIEHGVNMSLPDIPLSYLDAYARASVRLKLLGTSYYWGSVTLDAAEWGCRIEIDAPKDVIADIGAVVKEVMAAAPIEPPAHFSERPFRVFIGHGADPQWKYLQSALEIKYGFEVDAFESMERTGTHTLNVVDGMIRNSQAAVVILTGEDKMEDGSLRARENVIHELGYCQGALGIHETIILLEDGVSEPSNIAGLTQIRFRKGALIDVEAMIVEALNNRKSSYGRCRA